MKRSLKLFVALLFLCGYIQDLFVLTETVYAKEEKILLVDDKNIEAKIYYKKSDKVIDWKVDYRFKSKDTTKDVKLRFDKSSESKELTHAYLPKNQADSWEQKEAEVLTADQDGWYIPSSKEQTKQGVFAFQTPTEKKAIELEVQLVERTGKKELLKPEVAGPYTIQLKGHKLIVKGTDKNEGSTTSKSVETSSSMSTTTVTKESSTTTSTTDSTTTTTTTTTEPTKSSSTSTGKETSTTKTSDPSDSTTTTSTTNTTNTSSTTESSDKKPVGTSTTTTESSEPTETSESTSTEEPAEVPEPAGIPQKIETKEKIYYGETALGKEAIIKGWQKELTDHDVTQLELAEKVQPSPLPRADQTYVGTATLADGKTIPLVHQVEVATFAHEFEVTLDEEKRPITYSPRFTAKRTTIPEHEVTGRLNEDRVKFSELGVGDYEITETTPADIQSAGPWLLTVKKDGTSELKEKASGQVVQRFENQRRKKTALFSVVNDQERPLADVPVKLLQEGTLITEVRSDQQGQIAFDELALDNYQISPQDTKDYHLAEALELTVKADKIIVKMGDLRNEQLISDDYQADFTANQQLLAYQFKPYELQVMDTDETEFLVKDKASEEVQSLTEQAEGQHVLPQLSLGAYTLYEDADPVGEIVIEPDGKIRATAADTTIDQAKRLIIINDRSKQTELPATNDPLEPTPLEPIEPLNFNLPADTLNSLLDQEVTEAKAAPQQVPDEENGWLPKTGGIGIRQLVMIAALFGLVGLGIGAYLLYRNRKEAD